MLLTLRKLIVFSFICTGVVGFAIPNWNLTSDLESVPGKDTLRHYLEFSKDGEAFRYQPSKPPYGLISEERVHIGDKEYFLTGWAFGAATVIFRVFEPESNKGKPLCEKISNSESAQLRLKNKKIQIEITEPDQTKTRWVDCS